MSRRNLTANGRAFGRNPKSFLDQMSKAPIELTINDGVNPEYTIKVDPVTNTVINSDDLPPSVGIQTHRDSYTHEGSEVLP